MTERLPKWVVLKHLNHHASHQGAVIGYPYKVMRAEQSFQLDNSVIFYVIEINGRTFRVPKGHTKPLDAKSKKLIEVLYG